MAAAIKTGNSDSISRRNLRWLVIGTSTYCVYTCVAKFLATLLSSLNWNRNNTLKSRNGFTLIELMIVLTIVGILAAIAVPNYQWALIRAREAVLQENLYGIRSAIDQYYADQGMYPDKLEDLIHRKYLREIPRDPFTQKNDTWLTIPPPAELPPETGGSAPQPVGALPLPKGTIYDVQSGSDLIGSNSKPYKEW